VGLLSSVLQCGVCGRDHVGIRLRWRGEELSERPDARAARPAGWRAARGPDEVLALRRVAHVLLLQLLRVGRAGAAGRSERQGPWNITLNTKQHALALLLSSHITRLAFKGTIKAKLSILSSFPHYHVAPNLYEWC